MCAGQCVGAETRLTKKEGKRRLSLWGSMEDGWLYLIDYRHQLLLVGHTAFWTS